MLLLTAGNLIPSSPQEVADNLPAYTSEISSSWQASLGPWAGLALLFLGLALGWKQFANRVPAASTAAPKESTELKEQLERLRYLHELEVSRLQSDLEQKQQELTASTTHLMRLNQTIGDMKEQLAAINLQDRRGAEKQLHRISHEVATLSQPDEDWSHFEMLFNETHDDYIQRLKTRFGSLTIRDLRLCSYLRLNLTSKEIAPLMGISYRAIEAMRYRVRKKLGLSSDDNLTAFLLEF
ncbi:MAG TPA: hypothetical protein DCR93_12075 [Cytophagales bacterium]|nr:hypothetical protein [Cytophagales bacterium]